MRLLSLAIDRLGATDERCRENQRHRPAALVRGRAMTIADRYTEALGCIPPPGGGCHPSLLSVANLGALAGIEPEQIHEDIRQAIPYGRRQIPDKEISDAIQKALQDHRGGTFIPRPRPKPAIRDGKAALQKIIDQGSILDEADLWEASPLRLWEYPQDDPVLLLDTLFEPADLVWIGERYEPGIPCKTIKTAESWIDYFRNGGATAPHIIINPLNGTPAPTKSGDKNSLRGDGNAAAFRYCLVEFDTLSREDQIRFWSAVKLPIIALTDSGGKSIHAWLDVQKLAIINTSEQWLSGVKGHLYDRILTPLGVDGACSNPARLSRLPGYYRAEKQKYQRLLWLSPEGRSIC